MPKKQVAPGGDGRSRTITVDNDAAGRKGVKGFSRLVGIDEYVEVDIQGSPGLRVEAKGQGAADRVIDSRRAKESGDLDRQFGRGQVPRCSRHWRLSRARIRG